MFFLFVIYGKLSKLIYVNTPRINNNKGNSVNIVLKDDQKGFPFL